MPKIEEWVDRSQRTVRADKLTNASSYWVHRGRADDAAGDRAGEGSSGGPATVVLAGRGSPSPVSGCSSTGDGAPKAPGPGGGSEREKLLFCAWLAWCRLRVVIPVWDRTLPTVISCIDSTLRAIGGAPTCLLTDNEKTMTIDRVAGIAVRLLKSCPRDATTACKYTPASRSARSPNGGGEASIRIAKTNLIPTSANPREKHGSFAELRGACAIFWRQVNTRVHRETGRAPASALDGRTHPPAPADPHTLNLDRAATFSGAAATSTATAPVQARARTAT